MPEFNSQAINNGSFREREELLNALFRVAQVGLVIIDQNHKVIDANNCFANMLGYSPEEVKSLHTWDWEANYSSEDILDLFADLSTIDRKFESVHQRKDGTTYPVEISATGTKYRGENVILCVCVDISAKKQAEEQLVYISIHDQLTGLFNRVAYEQYKKRVENNPEYPICLFSCDMSGLKEVNDIYGHLEGDRLIKKCADIISAAVDNDGFVARLGGDEFIIILPETNIREGRGIRRRIIENIKQINLTDKPQIYLAIGMAVCSDGPLDFDQLFRQADDNMYRFKRLAKIFHGKRKTQR